MSEVEEIEAPAATEEVTNATESATEGQQEPQEGEPKPDKVQKRIDKATREKHDAMREAEFWKQEALKGRTAPAETQKTIEAKGEPSENDFQTHAEYVKALTKHYANQGIEEYKASQNIERAQTQAQTAQQEFKGRQEEFRAATPDFDEVLADADFQVSNAVISEIVSSDRGPELQYFLAKNPNEAERLSKLAPLALAREVGKIEARFTTSQPSRAAKTTGAPPPPKLVKNSSAQGKSIYDEDLSPAEYKVLRAKLSA